MKFFRSHTFLLFSSFHVLRSLCVVGMISSQLAFGMEKRCEPGDITEIDVSEPTKKASDSVELAYDEDGNFYCDQIYPFITEQKSALALRLTCKAVNKAFCECSKKYSPIRIKEINRENINDFMQWLRKNNKLGFYVALHLNNKYDIQKSSARMALDFVAGKNIGNNKFKEILNLFGEKLKALLLSNFNGKSLSISELSSIVFSGPNITSINLNDLGKTKLSSLELDRFSNIHYISLDDLPETLEFLTISGHFCRKFANDYLRDENFENLPKNLKLLDISSVLGVTGKCFSKFPKSLLFLKLGGVEEKGYAKKEFLKNLPENCTIYA